MSMSIIISPPSPRFLTAAVAPPPPAAVVMAAEVDIRENRRCEEERHLSIDTRRERDLFRTTIRASMKERGISVRAMADHLGVNKSLLSDFFASRNFHDNIVNALTAFRDNPVAVKPPAKRSRSAPVVVNRDWKRVKFEINHYYEDEMWMVTKPNYLAMDFLITEYEICEHIGKWAEFTVEMTAVNNRHDVAIRQFICDRRETLESQIASFKRTVCIVTRMYNKTTGNTYTRPN